MTLNRVLLDRRPLPIVREDRQMSGLRGGPVLAHRKRPRASICGTAHFEVDDVRHTVEHAGWRLRARRRLARRDQGRLPRGGRRGTRPPRRLRRATSTPWPTVCTTSTPATPRARSCSGTAGAPRPGRPPGVLGRRSACSAPSENADRGARPLRCPPPRRRPREPGSAQPRLRGRGVQRRRAQTTPGRSRPRPARGVPRGRARRVARLSERLAGWRSARGSPPRPAPARRCR